MARVDFKNDNQQDERLDPYSDNARDLYKQEQDAYDREFDDIANNFDESASGSQEDANIAKTKNIDATKDKEENGGGWKTNVSENGNKKTDKKEPTTFWAQAKKKGPMGTIIALVGGGGLIGGGLLSPAGALIHIKEILVNKFDTMSSAMEERTTIIMSKRMFGTNTTCKIKVRCRFSGLTNRQMERLRIQGADILDKDGKPIKRNALGRYTGGKTLVLSDGTKVDASAYKKTLRSNPALRDIGRSVFAPRYASWNDKISKDIRAKKRLVTNPEWGNGDDKEARKDVFKAVSGEGYTAQSQDVPDSEKTTTNSDGKKVPTGEDLAQQTGDMADSINSQSEALKTAASNGDLINPIPSDAAGAATMAETKVTGSLLKSVAGFLNPADILVGLCGTYKLTKTIVYAARALVVVNAMRYASQFLSTADKIKAGEATSTDAEQAMNIMERTDEYGDNFGDAVGYQYSEYNTVPDKPLGFSMAGNGVILVFTTVINWINSHLGKTLVNTGCKVLTNPIVQGALALSSFIPGGGQITGAITKVGVKLAEDGAKKLIQDMVKKMIEAATAKIASKEALKAAAKTAGKEFLKLAAGAGGIFLAGYLTERYAVPYMARVLAGAMLTGSEDGVTAMDTMAGGFDATNDATAQEGGLVPLSQQQAASYTAFNDSATATYVADMRAQSNPFDINDPYSMSNGIAASFYTFASKVESSSLLALPGAIFSALNPAKLFSGSTAFADTQNNCPEDTYMSDHNLATTPFCGPVKGVTDVDMLSNADPDTDVTSWMLDHNEIDGDGNTISGSDFDTYQKECLTDSPIMDPDIAGDSPTLPETCYDTSANASQARKMFSLYLVDQRVTDGMDAPDAPSTDSSQSGNKYISVGSIPESGLVVGASVFGGSLSGGQWVENLADNGGNDLGDHGNHMTGVPAIAELGNGSALGHIPDGTRLEITDNTTGNSIIAVKEDIGAGGADVQGHTRAIDLWWQTANALKFFQGTGVVTVHAVDPGTDLTPVASTGNNSKNIGFSLGNYIDLSRFNLFSPFTGVAL
jgi:hypothetical protein